MTNFQSVFGGAVWMTVAAALMMMALAPVTDEQKPTAASHVVAQAPAAPGSAAA